LSRRGAIAGEFDRFDLERTRAPRHQSLRAAVHEARGRSTSVIRSAVGHATVMDMEMDAFVPFWDVPVREPVQFERLQPGVRYHIVIGDC
jgi:hypothetical protein